jgi:hypothetical protein
VLVDRTTSSSVALLTVSASPVETAPSVCTRSTAAAFMPRLSPSEYWTGSSARPCGGATDDGQVTSSASPLSPTASVVARSCEARPSVTLSGREAPRRRINACAGALT